ncbi:ATPase [Gallicola sp. Sow4_E12]|uniref:ATPase n=1 Tax=Gallicola sp. Sow4_E12 TaxID=3438785 RepID=UPI003F93001B
MDLIQLIEEMEDLMDGASTVPFSKKVMVDADEVLEILTEMREALPEEIKQAQWVTEEKERIVTEAEREADAIRKGAQKDADDMNKDAQKRFEALINEHDITKQAEKYGEEIVSKAEQNARVLKMQSITYVDEMLATTQNKIQDLLIVLEDNRKELKKDK